MKIEFKEEQKFTHWWLWLILIGIGILPIFGIYKQLILGEKFGDKPMSDFGLIIFCVFIFCLIAMFSFMRLKTEINQNEIRMVFSLGKKPGIWRRKNTSYIWVAKLKKYVAFNVGTKV